MLVFLRAFKDLQRLCKDLAKIFENLGGSLPINIFTLQYDIQNFAEGGDSLKPKRLIEIVICKKIRQFLIDKTCFNVTNIIVSYRIFEKPLALYNKVGVLEKIPSVEKVWVFSGSTYVHFI